MKLMRTSRIRSSNCLVFFLSLLQLLLTVGCVTETNKTADVDKWLQCTPYMNPDAWGELSRPREAFDKWKTQGRELDSVERILLLKLSKEDDEKKLDRIIIGLAAVGREKSIRPLLLVLRTKSFGLRYRAGWALGEIGDIAAVEPLCDIVRNGDELARSNACLTLGALGGKMAKEALISALKDQSQSVRSFAEAGILLLQNNKEKENSGVCPLN